MIGNTEQAKYFLQYLLSLCRIVSHRTMTTHYLTSAPHPGQYHSGDAVSSCVSLLVIASLWWSIEMSVNMESGPGVVECLDLEINVIKRKRSLASMVNRRLVKSCHETEVCFYPSHDEESAVRVEKKYCFRPARVIQSVYCSYDRRDKTRKYFYNFTPPATIQCHLNNNVSSEYNTLVWWH